MVWFVSGTRKDIALAVSESGRPICHGGGTHECKPVGMHDFGGNIDHALLKKIQRSRCGWTVSTSTEVALHIDGGGDGLFERVQQAPDKSHGMIKYYEGEPDAVTFSIALPESTFKHFRRALELVLMSTDVNYDLRVEFLGFRVPHAQTETPTWQEFISGRPLFFNEVSLSVHAAASDA